MDAHFDRDEIIRAAKLLVPAGGITELRALDAKMSGVSWKGTASGYFSSPAKLADAVATIQSAKGVYIIPNAVNPALLARSANKLRVLGKSDPSTPDADIQRRHWLLIDLDPRRPSGVSSTAVEHAAAEAIAVEVRSWLKALDWPDPRHLASMRLVRWV